MAAQRLIPVGSASFRNPEWSVMHEGRFHFTQKGMDLVKSVLNKTGRAFMITGNARESGLYWNITYFGDLLMVLSLFRDESRNVFIDIHAIRHPNQPDELTDNEKRFLEKFGKNLAQALPQDGKMNLLTKPTIPAGTALDNLPPGLIEKIIQQASEYKDFVNPMKKLTGGRRKSLRRIKQMPKKSAGKTVKSLKSMLKRAGLKSTGRKAALTRRAKAAHLMRK